MKGSIFFVAIAAAAAAPALAQQSDVGVLEPTLVQSDTTAGVSTAPVRRSLLVH